MNINGIYFVHVYMVHLTKEVDGGLYTKGQYIKSTLVTRKDNSYYAPNVYVDLQTNEEYTYGTSTDTFEGDLYICKKPGLVPLDKLFTFKRQNMSKRRILKKFNDYKNQVKEKE